MTVPFQDCQAALLCPATQCHHPLTPATVQTCLDSNPEPVCFSPPASASNAAVPTASRLRSACRFPAPTLPLVSKWKDMIGTAFSLAIVGYVINLAMGRTLAAKHGYDVDPNQVMLALEGRGRGMFPWLSGVTGRPPCMRGKLADALCVKPTCCSRARGGLPGRGRKDVADPFPTGGREAAKR